MLPLVLLTIFVFQRGLQALQLPRADPHPEGRHLHRGPTTSLGGVAHAIVGTLEQVAIAAALGIPAAVLTAVFINEVGRPVHQDRSASSSRR